MASVPERGSQWFLGLRQELRAMLAVVLSGEALVKALVERKSLLEQTFGSLVRPENKPDPSRFARQPC